MFRNDFFDPATDSNSVAGGPGNGRQHLDLVLVPEAVFEARASNPRQLIQAVADFVARLTTGGQRSRYDLPKEATQILHAEHYLSSLENGGHAAFVAGSRHALSQVLRDVEQAMRASDAWQHLDLFVDLLRWVYANPRTAARLSVPDADVPALADFDTMFTALGRSGALEVLLADWIASWPFLIAVSPAELEPAFDALELNEGTGELTEFDRMARLEDQLTDPVRLGLGMAAARMPQPEPLVTLGTQTRDQCSQFQRRAWTVATTMGLRLGIETDLGFSLFERTVPAAPSGTPVRCNLSSVTHAEVATAATLCRVLDVSTALGLLLSAAPEVAASVDFVSIRSTNGMAGGPARVTALIVADEAQRGFTAVVEPEGAFLLSEPDHRVLASVGRNEISAQNGNRLAG